MNFKNFLLLLPLMSMLACTDRPEPLSESEKQHYIKKGNLIAVVTGSKLMGRMGEVLHTSGVQKAVTYCNTVAIPLVDSLSRVHGATIRRTSQRIRNPKDAPTDEENNMLLAYAHQEAAGVDLEPVAQALPDNRVAYYAPIRTVEMCMQCHGEVGTTVAPDDYMVIKELYPQDKATGYAVGDLRGMWSITFRRQ